MSQLTSSLSAREQSAYTLVEQCDPTEEMNEDLQSHPSSQSFPETVGYDSRAQQAFSGSGGSSGSFDGSRTFSQTPLQAAHRKTTETDVLTNGTKTSLSRQILILTMFLLTWAISFAALIIIASQSRRLNGFIIWSNVNPLVWTFGPTAFLTAVIALWRQIDYDARVQQPWLLVSHASKPVRTVLLLDYLSPIMPSTLISSCKNKHWIVVLTTLIQIILKLTMILSTGLLVAQDTLIHSGGAVSLSRLGGASNRSLDKLFLVDKIYGNLAGGLPYELGMSETALFEVPLQSNIFPFNTYLTTNVTAFVPDVQCEVATPQVGYQMTTSFSKGGEEEHFLQLQIRFQSEHCQDSRTYPSTGSRCNLTTWEGCDSERFYYGFSHSFDCTNFGPTGTSTDLYTQANALLFAVLQFGPNPSNDSSSSNQTNLVWSSAVICRLSFAFESANLTLFMGQDVSMESAALITSDTVTNSFSPDYGWQNLTSDVGDLTEFATYPMTALNGFSNADLTQVSLFYGLLLGTLSSRGNKILAQGFEPFQNVTMFTDSISTVLRTMAVEWMYAWLSQPNSSLKDKHTESNATWTHVEKRLHVQSSRIWSMGASLVIVSLATLLLVILVGLESSFAPGPKSLSAFAVYGHGNSAIKDIVRSAITSPGVTSGARRSPTQLKHSLLSPSSFRKRQKSHVTVSVSGEETCSSATEEKASKFWQPVSTRKWFIALCVCLTVCEIAILQILQHLSDSRQGFSSVTVSADRAKELITLIPSLIVVTTALMYSSVEWSVNVLSPYDLARNSIPQLKRIDQNESEALAPIAVVRALKKRLYGSSLMIVSTLLGSLLTIVVSGLYGVVLVPQSDDVALQTLSQFDTSLWSLPNDLQLDTDFALVVAHNASDPSGIYQDFVYPTIGLINSDDRTNSIISGLNDSGATLDVSTTVLRGALNCSVLPTQSINLTTDILSYPPEKPLMDVTLNATFELPKDCQYSTGIYEHSNVAWVGLEPSFWLDSDDFESYNTTALYIGDPDSDVTNPNIEVGFGYWPGIYRPPFCPSLAFVASRYARNMTVGDVTVLICTQLQEQVPAVLHFHIPEVWLDANNTPIVDEARRETVTGYQYDDFFPSIEMTFFETVTRITGFTASDFVGQENVQRFTESLQQVYRLSIAQFFNSASMRRTKATLNSTNNISEVLPLNTKITATIHDREHLRVVQNWISKTILQALLGGMLACIITTCLLTNSQGILPLNPCSIAGTLALLMDGQFSEECFRIASDAGDVDEPGRRLAKRRMQLGWSQAVTGDQPTFSVDFARS